MKRSAQVALVLMSAAAVGGTAYSMMPAENCVPRTGVAPGSTVPNSGVMNQGSQSCSTSRSWTSYFRSGRPLFGWGNSNSNTSSGTSPLGFTSSNNTTSTTTTSRTSIGGTQRGGFGSTSSSTSSRGS